MGVPETTVLTSFDALMQQSEEVCDHFLVAAVYARAIRQDTNPQNVVDALFKLVPDADAWPTFREMLLVALDEAGG